MKKLTVLLMVSLALLLVASTALAADGGRPLTTSLNGSEEVPGPGDPDGSGFAHITLNPGQGTVCWHISVSDITLPLTGAHIHAAPAGVAGPVVVPLSLGSGCTSASQDLILAIIKSPEQYYVNVHNADFPAGALRGQLSNVGHSD